MLAPTRLLEHKTQDYEWRNRWGYGSVWYYNFRRKPPFLRLLHVPAMLMNSRVQIVLQTFEGAITSLSHFFVKEDNEEIKQFLITQIERWWRNSASKMIYAALPYGYYGAETMYRMDEKGRLAFNYLKSFQAQDIYPVTLKGELVGLELRNVSGSKKRYIGEEKKLWHVHWRELHPWWGQSRLYGAYEPWLDLISEGGATDVRRYYFYRNSIQNDVGYYPDRNVPDENGTDVYAGDVMRSMIEKQRAGGVYSFPSTRDMNGNREWEIETKDTTGGEQGVLDFPEALKDEISEGMGMSSEVYKAADTGSGFSGRRIPESAFRGILTNIVQWMVSDIDEQSFRPLVKHNFQVEPSYEIIPFGIVRDEGDEGEDEMRSTNTRVPKEEVRMAAEGALAV